MVAALVDLRTAADRGRFEAVAAELGTRISTVALARGSVALPPDVLDRAQRHLRALPAAEPAAPAAGTVSLLPALRPAARDTLPGGAGTGGPSDRYGSEPAGFGAAARTAAAAADQVLGALPASALAEGILVLGTEEHLHLPLLLADRLSGLAPAGTTVKSPSTPRSPIVALERADYAIGSAVEFASHDDTIDGPGRRFAYNLSRPGARYGTIVVVPEPGPDPAAVTAPGSLTAALATACDRALVVRRPGAAEPGPAAPAARFPAPLHGPEFGSYAAGEVSWLLKDLSQAQL
ncbi:phosphoribosyltransferase, partial [Arthrobacter deserti]|nr:phosphoribosyltransferase [Arthrobacter deserti]